MNKKRNRYIKKTVAYAEQNGWTACTDIPEPPSDGDWVSIQEAMIAMGGMIMMENGPQKRGFFNSVADAKTRNTLRSRAADPQVFPQNASRIEDGFRQIKWGDVKEWLGTYAPRSDSGKTLCVKLSTEEDSGLGNVATGLGTTADELVRMIARGELNVLRV